MSFLLQVSKEAGQELTAGGIVESVNGTLKVECVNDVHFETPEQARQEIVEFIGYYNTECRHSSSLGNIAPAEFERRWRAGSNPTPTELPQ